MTDVTSAPPAPKSDAEYEDAVDELLADIQRMQETWETGPGRQDAVLLEELAAVRQELRTLTQTVQQMQTEMRHDREMAARSQETLLLRLENWFLRSERQLPPGPLLGEPSPPQ